MGTQIKDKVALVTGANRGIGKATAEALLAAGAAKVYLAVRTLETASELESKFGEKVQAIHVDVGDKNSITALAETATDVNIVVNNAGILEVADPLAENFEEAFEKELAVNVYGLQRMASAFAPILEKNGGAFVQLNSIASINNFTPFTSYCASKAAAYSVTQGIRELFLAKGIQVVSVHPGPIATDMAINAGMEEMADDVNTVSNGIVSALENGDFHLFPDSMAKDFQAAYQSYAENVVEPIQTEE